MAFSTGSPDDIPGPQLMNGIASEDDHEGNVVGHQKVLASSEYVADLITYQVHLGISGQ